MQIQTSGSEHLLMFKLQNNINDCFIRLNTNICDNTYLVKKCCAIFLTKLSKPTKDFVKVSKFEKQIFLFSFEQKNG